MSYFYLKPIQGNTSLHVLEECVLKRWDYFNKYSENQGVCQYIIEGSVYDNIGHFSLHYIAMCSKNEFLINSVLKFEEELFYRRLKMGTANNLRLLCKYILKYIRLIPNNSIPYFGVLEDICQKLILKHVANHLINKEHSYQCSTYTIHCHFTLCLDFIKNRRVEITNGVASIPCGKWITFFTHIFRMHLQYRNNTLPSVETRNIDPRCREIILKLTHTISYNNEKSNTSIHHKDIEGIVDYFPLCMKTLHKSLRHKHRLSHNERFRYSLFLKDIGLPLNEAIFFWQNEYSKPSSHHSTCCHDWKKNSKKYIYGLRHLYGLEGSRKNYSMVGCRAIQNSSFKEGGCPFKHYDAVKLQELINTKFISADNLKDINYTIKFQRYSEACFCYNKSILNHLNIVRKTDNNCEIKSINALSPINYFKSLNIRK